MFNVQKVGVLSPDSLGMVWQCNVFGHYVLVSRHGLLQRARSQPLTRTSSVLSSRCSLHGRNEILRSRLVSSGCLRSTRCLRMIPIPTLS